MKGLLFDIADTLQMDLMYLARGKKVKAEGRVDILQDSSFDIVAQVESVASFVNTKQGQVGILLHVMGDMQILVTNNGAKNTVSLFIIDKTLKPYRVSGEATVFKNTTTIRKLVTKLQPSIKKSYTRSFTSGIWKEFTLPEDVKS